MGTLHSDISLCENWVGSAKALLGSPHVSERGPVHTVHPAGWVSALGLTGCSEPKSTALPHPRPLREEVLAMRWAGGLQSSHEGGLGRTWGDTGDSIDPLALNFVIITIQVGLTMAAYWPQLLSTLPPPATLKCMIFLLNNGTLTQRWPCCSPGCCLPLSHRAWAPPFLPYSESAWCCRAPQLMSCLMMGSIYCSCTPCHRQWH
jgi:hypothetical protein